MINKSRALPIFPQVVLQYIHPRKSGHMGIILGVYRAVCPTWVPLGDRILTPEKFAGIFNYFI
jgi:hypothetical protein